MKRILLLLLLVLSSGLLLLPGLSLEARVSSINSVDILSSGLDVRNYASINAAVTAIGATETTLVVPNAQTLTASLTIPATLSLKILKGGSIVKASTYTITINGTFEAGLYQVFSGFASGDVTFGADAVEEVKTIWWGTNTTPGTTDMYGAIIASLNATYSGSKVILPAGSVLFKSKIVIPKRLEISGVGAGKSNLTTQPAGTHLIKDSTLNDTGIDVTGGNNVAGTVLENFSMGGNAGNGGDGIVLRVNNGSLRNITVMSQGGNGIRVGDDIGTNSNDPHLDNITVRENTSHGLYVHSSTPDANAGNYNNIVAIGNGGDGVRVGKATINTFIGGLFEINTGYGMNFTSDSYYNAVYGGDSHEGNGSGDIYNAGSYNVFIGTNTTSFTDVGTDTMILDATHLQAHQLSIKPHFSDGRQFVANINKQIFMSATPDVTDGVEKVLFTATLPVTSAIFGTIYLSYIHGDGGEGQYYCVRAYSIVAITDNTGLEVGTTTVIPEYSYDSNLTTNTMRVAWDANVLTVANTNNQAAGPGMLLAWSFIGHHRGASNFYASP